MPNKIAKIDAEAMNSLYASEVSKLAGGKVAEDKTAPQAFKDHKEYLDTLEDALKDSKGEFSDPNGPTVD